MIEEDLYIIKESGVLVVRSNGINVELTDYSTGAEIKEAIGNVMKTLDIRRIYKDDSFVEFIYHRKFDRYRIIYSTDNERMEAYTRMEELGEDWYFGHVLQE